MFDLPGENYNCDFPGIINMGKRRTPRSNRRPLIIELFELTIPGRINVSPLPDRTIKVFNLGCKEVGEPFPRQHSLPPTVLARSLLYIREHIYTITSRSQRRRMTRTLQAR